MRVLFLEIRFFSFFSEAPVHLFNANIIKSEHLIESIEMPRNLPTSNIFHYCKKFCFPDSQGNHCTDDKNKPAWEMKFEPD